MFPELITELLQDGYKVNFSAPGHSMFPTIMANETIMVEPIDPETVSLADIVLYRTNGQLIAHRVISIEIMPEVSKTPSRSLVPVPFQIPIKGESPLLPAMVSGISHLIFNKKVFNNRSAPPRRQQRGFTSDFRSECVHQQAQRSSNEVLHHRSALHAQHSSNEVLRFIFRGDAAAACDEPVKASQILGKVISIERYGCSISPYSSTHKLSCFALFWMARIKRLPRIIFSIFSFNGR